MMRLSSLASVICAFALAGCASEIAITNQNAVQGEPNPADIETPINEDRVVQVTTPLVDVLWAIDNSCSMEDEQESLAYNFPFFMDFFVGSGLDYHVGVISTDMDDPSQSGYLRQAGEYKFIDEETLDPNEVFRRMATLGIGGSGDERGREAVYNAVELKKESTTNKGFLRKKASLHVVLISDENDHSTSNPIGRGEFAEYLLDLKGDPELVTFSSIVNQEGCCGGGAFSDEEPGSDYMWITDQVGGIKWDIRSSDWAEVLEALGVQASGLKREFFLSELPVEGTIRVWVDYEGIVYTFEEFIDWEYNAARNSVVFYEYVPEALAEVYIEYDVLAALQE
jgi:hypothetical protein